MNDSNELAIKRIQHQLCRNGDLTWCYKEEQLNMEAFVNSCPDKLKILNVARQTGKTFWTVARTVGRGIRYAKQVMFYASAYLEDLRKFIHPTYQKVIDLLPDDIKPKRKGSDYVFKNGSTIYVVGVDKNPNAGRGNTIDMYVVDEAGFVKNLKYLLSSVVYPAMRQSQKKHEENPDKYPAPEIIIPSTPPESPEHYFRELSLKAQKDDHYFLMPITETTATEWDMEQYKKECSTETDFEREYMCRFVSDDAKAVIPGFSKVRNSILTRYVRPPHINQHTAGDHGHKDNTGLVFGYFDVYGGKIVIEDSVSLVRPLTSQIAEAIFKNEKRLFNQYATYRPIDSSPQVVADLCSTYNCVTNKVSLNKKMRDRMLRLRQLIDGGILVINDTPGNRLLANEIEYSLWKDPTTKLTFERSSIYGHYDRLAALGYFIDTIDTSSNPRPNDEGIDYSNDIIIELPDYNKDHSLDEIGAGFTDVDLDYDTELL